MRTKYTTEHIEFIKNNITACPFKELTDRFNQRFGVKLSVGSVVALSNRRGLHNGIDAKLKKGNTPHNKGKKGCGGWQLIPYKKGNKTWNYKPIGAERINSDGYIEVKVADPNKWRGKHILTWESHNGPVPKGHVVIFGDGDPRNFDPSNLILISRRQLLILNSKNLIQKDADLTRTAVIIVDLHSKINKRKSGK